MERFERCFRRVTYYVGRRVQDRETQERIVTCVLVDNLDLFIAPHEELEELTRCKASADRHIALERSARSGPDASLAVSDSRAVHPDVQPRA